MNEGRPPIGCASENRLLKRLGGLSRTAISKTRSLLGVKPPTSESEAREAESPTSGEGSAKEPAANAPQAREGANRSRPSRDRQSDKRRPEGGSGGGSSNGSRSGSRNNPRSAAKRAKPAASASGVQPIIVPRSDHVVSRKSISRSAVKVLNKLDEAGHAAYLVGGGVRDALVGLKPKDFDIATDASPEEVRALFRNSRIIGRRFRLVHVVFGREIIEVATFRAAHDKGEGGEVGVSGRIVRDNVYGTIEEDALRRDFSVNALYYNIADFSVVDYAGGLADLEAKVFHLIGDPTTRCEEDPVRILRAVRLAAKLRFSIHDATQEAMKATAPELAHTPPARLFEEVLKLFQGGYAERSFHAVVEHDLLKYLFPLLDKRLKAGDDSLRTMLDEALANTDRRVEAGKPITPAYLLAFMLWPDVEECALKEMGGGLPPIDALHAACEQVLGKQLKVISIPRRFSGPMKEIWLMQPRLERWRGKRALGLLEERRFRAAYDFLCLRASQNPVLAPLAEWWTEVQTLDEEERLAAVNEKPEVASNWGGEVSEAADGEGDAGTSRPARRGAGGPSRASAAVSEDGKPKRRRRRRKRKPAGDRANPAGNGAGSGSDGGSGGSSGGSAGD